MTAPWSRADKRQSRQHLENLIHTRNPTLWIKLNKLWDGYLVQWHIIPCGLFNAKSCLYIYIYILLYRWFNKGIPQVQADELASLSESD